MPYLDVTALFVDPLIAGEAFDVIRRRQIMGSNGVTTVQNTYYRAQRGSIGPAGASVLERLADQQFAGKALDVITQFRLRGPAKEVQGYSFQPDLVIWKGDYYIVQSVSDFSQYGAGFVQAVVTSIDYVDQAPDANTAQSISKDFTQPQMSDQIPPVGSTD